MAANTPFSVAFWAHVYIGPPGPLRPGSDDQKAVVIIIKELQLTLEQHEFELCLSIYMQIFYTNCSWLTPQICTINTERLKHPRILEVIL